jgi:hypothetical protein
MGLRHTALLWFVLVLALPSMAGVLRAQTDPETFIARIEGGWPRAGAVVVVVRSSAHPDAGFETAYHFDSRAWFELRWMRGNDMCSGRLPDGRRFWGRAGGREWSTLDDGGRENQGAPGRIFPQLLLTAMLREPGAFQDVREVEGGWVFGFRLPRGQLGQRLEEIPASFLETLGGPEKAMKRVEVHTDARFFLTRIVHPEDPERGRVIETDERGPAGFQVASLNSDVPNLSNDSVETLATVKPEFFGLERVMTRAAEERALRPRRIRVGEDAEVPTGPMIPMRGADTTPLLARPEVWFVVGGVFVGGGVVAWFVRRRYS